MMLKTHIGLSPNLRQDMIQSLNARLVDAIDLGVQLKMAHWNVRGPHFIGLHKLFDEIVAHVQESADQLAERIGQLGGIVHANVQEVAKNTSLGMFDSNVTQGNEMIGIVVQALSAFANKAREEIDTAAEKGDAITADLLTDIVRETDKYLWFVEAHQQ